MELNPGFDGKMAGDGFGNPKIENGVVTEFGILTNKVSDVSPVRALAGLKVLFCPGSGSGTTGKGKLSDISPLSGMNLTKLNCRWTSVDDLSCLEGMPLVELIFYSTPISDLSPLEDCKNLTLLNVKSTKVTPASVAALQKALPNCKIQWDDPARPKTPEPAASGSK